MGAKKNGNAPEKNWRRSVFFCSHLRNEVIFVGGHKKNTDLRKSKSVYMLYVRSIYYVNYTRVRHFSVCEAVKRQSLDGRDNLTGA